MPAIKNYAKLVILRFFGGLYLWTYRPLRQGYFNTVDNVKILRQVLQ